MLDGIEVKDYGLQEPFAAYYLAYDEALRARLAAQIRSFAETTLEVSNADRTVSVYPRFLESTQQIVIHMVNSDYVPDEDKIRPKSDIGIRLKRPAFYEPKEAATLLTPDKEGDGDSWFKMSIPVSEKDGFLEMTIPFLEVYDVVVL